VPEKTERPAFREVFARHWRRYHAAHGARVPRTHLRAAQAILDCHTAALGGSLYACADCGQRHYAHHSCNHRNCPGCGAGDAIAWADRQQGKLLPEVPYSMVTFTVPEGLRRTFRSNQELCYRLLFKASAGALQEVAAMRKHLGAQLGMTGVLHTWTRQMEYHPHIHYIIAQGGLTPAGGWARSKTPKYFLPVKLLATKTRIALQAALGKEDPTLYATIPAAEWHKTWNVHISAAGNGTHAVGYLSRYVNQTALSRKRILSDDGGHVTISYTESGSGKKKPLRLPGGEFVRRFLQHVLPKGFKRVRHFGWSSPAAHKKLARIRALLDWHPPTLDATTEPHAPSCKRCEGQLTLVTTWKRGRAPPMLKRQAIPLHD
jgi:hypothetical protein